MAKTKSFALILGVLTMSFLIGYLVFAWQEPTAPPPEGNVLAPLNVGTTAQTKQATLTINPGELQAQLFRDVDAGCGQAGGSWYVNPSGISVLCGNVGIGTTSPGAKFEVAGQAKITGGNPGAGKVLTSDATGLASWQTPAGGLPSGSSGQTLRHDGTSWVANSVLFNNGTNVGIGTTSPEYRLDVRADTISAVANFENTGINGWGIRAVSGSTGYGVYAESNGGCGVYGTATGSTGKGVRGYAVSSGGVGIYGEAINGAYAGIFMGGNVGIGTTNPGEKLEISGSESKLKIAPRPGGHAELILDRVNSSTNAAAIRFQTNGVTDWWTGVYTGTSDYGWEAGGSNRMYLTSTGNLGIGTASPGTKLEVAGPVKITGGNPGAGKVLTSDASGLASWQTLAGVPSGVIVMWSGTLASIPAGWALCDGTQGTPDLRDRFILGTSAGENPGGTGGAHFRTLTVNELPAHNHSGAALSAGSHTHNVQVRSAGSAGTRVMSTYSGWSLADYQSTESAGAHSHSLSINNTGGGQAFDNRPAFYKLAFIMKL